MHFYSTLTTPLLGPMGTGSTVSSDRRIWSMGRAFGSFLAPWESTRCFASMRLFCRGTCFCSCSLSLIIFEFELSLEA